MYEYCTAATTTEPTTTTEATTTTTEPTTTTTEPTTTTTEPTTTTTEPTTTTTEPTTTTTESTTTATEPTTTTTKPTTTTTTEFTNTTTEPTTITIEPSTTTTEPTTTTTGTTTTTIEPITTEPTTTTEPTSTTREPTTTTTEPTTTTTEHIATTTEHTTTTTEPTTSTTEPTTTTAGPTTTTIVPTTTTSELKTTTEHTTTLPPSFPQNPARSAVGLNEKCGHNSSIGYCVVGNSSCTPSASGDWMCRCISGYMEKESSCFPVPKSLFSGVRNITLSAQEQTYKSQSFSVAFNSDARNLCTEAPSIVFTFDPEGKITPTTTCDSLIFNVSNIGITQKATYSFSVFLELSMDAGKLIINDGIVIIINVDFAITTTETRLSTAEMTSGTLTPCPQELPRSGVGLNEYCGNHSSTGYCVVKNSACVLGVNGTWKCMCVAGYVQNKLATECLSVPRRILERREYSFEVAEDSNLRSIFKLPYSEEAETICWKEAIVSVVQTGNHVNASNYLCKYVEVNLARYFTTSEYNFAVTIFLPIGEENIVVNDFSIVRVVVIPTKATTCTITPVTTSLSKTETPCSKEASILNRTATGLVQPCGIYSSTGYCNVQNSACVQDTDMVWRCLCISGYLMSSNGKECTAVPGSLVDGNFYSTSVADNITSGSVVYEVNLKRIVRDSCSEDPMVSVDVGSNVFDAKGSCQSIIVKTKSDIPSSVTEFNIAVTVAMHFNSKRISVNDVVFITVTVVRKVSELKDLCVLIPNGIFKGDLIAKVPEEYLTPDYEPALDSKEFQISKTGEIRSRIKIEIPKNDLVAYYIQENIETKSGTNARTEVIPLHVFMVRNTLRIAIEEDKGVNFKIFHFNFRDTNVSISSSDIPANFKLDKGGLYIKEALDFETGSRIMDFTLKFEITCTGFSNLTAITTVTIEVLDVNNKPPVFLSADNKVLDLGKGYVFSIFPSKISNTIVGFLKVRDVDTNSEITFKMDQQHQTYFKIDNVGIIETVNSTNNIPFSNISDNNQYSGEYTMNVMASDGKRDVMVRVVVQLRQQPALNLGLKFFAEVLENSPIGSFVTFLDMSGYTYFNFVSTQRAEIFLRINSTTGKVVTNGPIDREKTPAIKFSIIATKVDKISCSFTVLGDLHINITDENDNGPRFSQMNGYSGQIIEESGLNQKLQMKNQISAADDDVGENAVFEFSIISGDPMNFFVINKASGIISTVKNVDREINAAFILTVEANDGVNTANTTVSVEIIDINDNAPTFNVSSQSVMVTESSAVDSLVVTVHARDSDLGENGKVFYSIKDVDGYFKVDRDSGQIRIAHELDRESKSFYTFTVTARDNGDQVKKGSMALNVTVSDVNDNDPVFLTATLSVTVPENVACGVGSLPIFKVSAIDDDEGANSKITFEMDSDNSDNFTISAEGDIVCKNGLDYEMNKLHYLSVVAADGGAPLRKTTATATITVTDVNDNWPVFLDNFADGNYKIRVKRSDWDSPKPLMVASATDADSGKFGKVKVNIRSGEIITVDHLGIIRTKPPAPDSEDLQVIFQATDGGSPPHTSSNVSLTIDVVNDNIASQNIRFPEKEIEMSITENNAEGHVIGEIKSKVQNPGNKSLTLELVTNSRVFSIDNVTGDITTNAVFDREVKSEYLLVVRALDVFDIDNSDLALIKLVVTDVNDNTPVFTKSKYVAAVCENAGIGVPIVTLTATDIDIGINADVQYEKFGDDSCMNTYTVDANSGAISVLQNIDYETYQSCVFYVKATDQGQELLNSSVKVEINILDFNDNYPEFENTESNGGYFLEISEDMRINDEVNAFGSITDKDSRQNGDVIFEVKNNEVCPFTAQRGYPLFGQRNSPKMSGDKFKIVLSVSSELDYERNKYYNCVIEAKDQGSPPRSSNVTTIVNVLDVNDNAPVFSVNLRNVAIKRDADIGFIVVNAFNVTDMDSGNNAEIQYNLGEKYVKYFSVDLDIGVMTVKDSLYDLQEDIISVLVLAVDKGTPALTGSTTVTITIQDENIKPTFLDPVVRLVRPENTRFSEGLVTVTAEDREGSKMVQCDCTYRFTRPSKKFEINKETGEIKFLPNITLDREAEAEIKFEVIARDAGEPPKESSPMSVVVRVEDVNDNGPKFKTFKGGDYVLTTHQLTPIGTVLGVVEAEDADEGENAIPVYVLDMFVFSTTPLLSGEETGKFPETPLSINRSNGSIVTNASLDINASADYFFLVYVIAEDSKDSTLTQDRMKVTVKVRFDDSNKHSPIFRKDIYKVSLDIEKDYTKDTDVVVVQATDDDDGREGEIVYSISDGNIRDIYGIDTSTGRIYLHYDITGGFSYDSVLTVIARDKGLVPKQSNCSVHVKYIGIKAACIDARKAEAEVEAERQLGRKYLSAVVALAVLLSVLILSFFSMVYKKISANKKAKLLDHRHYREKNFFDPRSTFSNAQTNPYYLLDRTKTLSSVHLPSRTSIDAPDTTLDPYFTDNSSYSHAWNSVFDDGPLPEPPPDY